MDRKARPILQGIENNTLETCDEILQRVLPAHMVPRTAFLSGPSFAAEVRRPLAFVRAGVPRDQRIRSRLSPRTRGPRFPRCLSYHRALTPVLTQHT